MSLSPRKVLGLAFVLAVALASPARATNITVNTTADGFANDGHCSLREAFVSVDQGTASGTKPGECPAGSGSSTNTIIIPAGEYALTQSLGGELFAGNSTPLLIQGAGASTTTISQTQPSSVLLIDAAAPVTISGLTITGGHLPDAAPTVDGTDGGGVNMESAQSLTIDGCTIFANRAGSATASPDVAGQHGTPGQSVTAENGARGGRGGAIFSFSPGSTVTVRDSTITGNTAGNGGEGGSAGGGAGDDGNATSGGFAGGNGTGGNGGSGGDGGAIWSAGTVNIVNSTITQNTAGTGGAGGGASGGQGGEAGTPAIAGATGGSATGGRGGKGGSGGAIVAEGPLSIVNSTIAGNTAGDGGVGGTAFGGTGGYGGPSGSKPGGLPGTGTGGPAGDGGDGGGIQAAAELNVTGSLFDDNAAGAGGTGGAGNGGGGGNGGLPDGNGNNGGNGVAATGGRGGTGSAILGAGSSTIADSTVTSNSAGRGGFGGVASASFVGTGAGTGKDGAPGVATGGNGGAAGSGALAASGGTLDLVQDTMSANDAGDPGGGGTGTAGMSGSAGAPGVGGVEAGAPTTLTASIVSANGPVSCSGSLVDGGHDISFPDATCPGTRSDPKLAALADNGGPTRTESLGAGSPAIDLVPANGAGCQASDQRGVARPQGGGCDAGAYESAPPSVDTGPATGVTISSASLSASVNPNLQAASYHFEFGQTTAYGSSTPPQDAGAGNAAVAVAATLTGLQPGTPYHYRLVASNADGTSTSADGVFITLFTTHAHQAPVFLAASMRPSVFAINRKGKAERPVASAVKKGTTFHYSLSEASRVVFTIQRSERGRRVKKRCVKPTRRNARKRSCRRFVKVARFAVAARAGASSKKFSGRIGHKALRPGRYHAVLVAVDSAGARSKPKVLNFRVVRP